MRRATNKGVPLPQKLPKKLPQKNHGVAAGGTDNDPARTGPANRDHVGRYPVSPEKTEVGRTTYPARRTNQGRFVGSVVILEKSGRNSQNSADILLTMLAIPGPCEYNVIVCICVVSAC